MLQKPLNIDQQCFTLEAHNGKTINGEIQLQKETLTKNKISTVRGKVKKIWTIQSMYETKTYYIIHNLQQGQTNLTPIKEKFLFETRGKARNKINKTTIKRIDKLREKIINEKITKTKEKTTIEAELESIEKRLKFIIKIKNKKTKNNIQKIRKLAPVI